MHIGERNCMVKSGDEKVHGISTYSENFWKTVFYLFAYLSTQGIEQAEQTLHLLSFLFWKSH